MTGECRNCIFWKSHGPQYPDIDTEQGECRRHAPGLFPSRAESPLQAQMSPFPITLRRDWCGDFEYKGS